MGYMNFNVERKITGNKHFRRAIAMAYDKAALVNNVLKKTALIVSNGLVPKGFAGKPRNGERLCGRPWRLTHLQCRRSAKELALAKQELGMDTIEVTLLTSDQVVRKWLANIYKRKSKKNLPGVTLNIKSVPLKTVLNYNVQMISTSSSEHGHLTIKIQ